MHKINTKSGQNMIDFDNRTDKEFDISLLERIALHMSDRDVELLLVDGCEMREINNAHRGIDKDTDVLSFPIEGDSPLPLGAILLSLDKIISEATARNHSIEHEAALLFIHGMLHLLGYDHECDSGEHRAKEEELISYFELPTSLIVRTIE